MGIEDQKPSKGDKPDSDKRPTKSSYETDFIDYNNPDYISVEEDELGFGATGDQRRNKKMISKLPRNNEKN